MEHKLFDRIELESFAHNGSRYYILPKSGVAVPSVTTVLYKDTKFSDHPAFRKAARRGTDVHDLCEQYLKTHEVPKKMMPSDKAIFDKIKKVIDEHVTEINLIEGCVYSKQLMTAGKVDLLCRWDGKSAVVDFKTSKRHKKESDLQNYCDQIICYGLLSMRCYNTFKPKNCYIVLANDDDPEAQVFKFEFTWTRAQRVVDIYYSSRHDHHN